MSAIELAETRDQDSVMFQALGDSARLGLLAWLATGEGVRHELAELEGEEAGDCFGSPSDVARRVTVKRRRKAKHIYCSLSDTQVLRLVECH